MLNKHQLAYSRRDGQIFVHASFLFFFLPSLVRDELGKPVENVVAVRPWGRYGSQAFWHRLVVSTSPSVRPESPGRALSVLGSLSRHTMWLRGKTCPSTSLIVLYVRVRLPYCMVVAPSLLSNITRYIVLLWISPGVISNLSGIRPSYPA